jgi:hypothetical protein
MKEDLFYQKNYWLNFAKHPDKDLISRDLHGSWDASKQAYTEYTEINPIHLEVLKANTSMNRVLDFGVGMGRNRPYLKTLFSDVHGFDTEPMVKNFKSKNPSENNVFDDWDDVSRFNYDAVYESVVMQHIPPQEVIYRLYQISSISKYLVSSTRCYNDFLRNFSAQKFGVNIACLISSIDAFEVVDCSIDLSLAKNLMNETHYQILYKSKNFK